MYDPEEISNMQSKLTTAGKLQKLKQIGEFLDRWSDKYPEAAKHIDTKAKILHFDAQGKGWWTAAEVDNEGRVAGTTEEEAEENIQDCRGAQDWKNGSDIRTRTIQSTAPKAKPNPYGSTHTANGEEEFSMEQIKRQFVQLAQRNLAEKNRKILSMCW